MDKYTLYTEYKVNKDAKTKRDQYWKTSHIYNDYTLMTPKEPLLRWCIAASCSEGAEKSENNFVQLLTKFWKTMSFMG